VLHRDCERFYDKQMDEHPGCPEILLREAGTGASNALADVGHGLYAEDLSKEYYFGDLAGQSSLTKEEHDERAASHHDAGR
jgi:cytochrome b involved in lipid metabolism